MEHVAFPERLSLQQKINKITWASVWRRVSRRFYRETELCIYFFDTAAVLALRKPDLMNKDSLADLEHFVPTLSTDSRTEFLSSAKERLATGGHCYTRVEDSKLVHYGWMTERQQKVYLNYVDELYHLPANCAVLYDFYTHPDYRGRGFYPSCLLQSAHDAAAIPNTEKIFLCILASDRSTRWWAEKFGAKYSGSFFYRKLLLSRKKWSTLPKRAPAER